MRPKLLKELGEEGAGSICFIKGLTRRVKAGSDVPIISSVPIPSSAPPHLKQDQSCVELVVGVNIAGKGWSDPFRKELER